jgi:hypothetical protein
MTDEGRHDQVLDTILDLQAKLRGDDISRRLASIRPKSEPVPSDEPALQLAPDPVSVRRGDLEVTEKGAATDRLEALNDRLNRVERELSLAMDRLRVAEDRYVRSEEDEELEALPPSPDRNVYQGVQRLQEIAAEREQRRRR